MTAKLINAKSAEKLCMVFAIVGDAFGKFVGKIAIRNMHEHQTIKVVKLVMDGLMLLRNPIIKNNCPIANEKKPIV